MKKYVVWRKYEFTAEDWKDAAFTWQTIKHNGREEDALVMESRIREDHEIATGLKGWLLDTLRQVTGGKV